MCQVSFFKYLHQVSQPLWMKNFNNEPSRQEPGHFFTNGLAPFLIKPPKKLLDRLKFWINIESVLSEFPRHSGMSVGFHAKMSRFSRMNLMSALSYFGSKLALIMNCLDESPGTKINHLGIVS